MWCISGHFFPERMAPAPSGVRFDPVILVPPLPPPRDTSFIRLLRPAVFSSVYRCSACSTARGATKSQDRAGSALDLTGPRRSSPATFRRRRPALRHRVAAAAGPLSAVLVSISTSAAMPPASAVRHLVRRVQVASWRVFPRLRQTVQK